MFAQQLIKGVVSLLTDWHVDSGELELETEQTMGKNDHLILYNIFILMVLAKPNCNGIVTALVELLFVCLFALEMLFTPISD